MMRYGLYIVVFLVGVLLNLFYTYLLTLNDVSFANIHAPVGSYAENVWRHSDVSSYLGPAAKFLEEGAFLRDGVPDYHRTIGYPFFLSLCMIAGLQHGNIMLWVVQSFVFALIYPVLLFLSIQIFPETQRFKAWLLGLYALTGAGIAYTPVLLTDQMANVTLWLSLGLGIAAIAGCRAKTLWVMHILVLAFSANVRPTLIFFPFAFWLLAFSVRSHIRPAFPSIRIVLLLLLLQVAAVQTPAFRNYRNHGVWMPTNVMAINLADYLAYNVLRQEGKTAMYESAREDWAFMPLAERQTARKTFALSVYRSYPVRTLRVLLINGCINTFESHWIMTRHLFRDELRSDLRGWGGVSPPWRLFHGAWALFHALLFLLASGRLLVAVVRKEWPLLGFVLFFSAPYLFSFTDAQGARFRLYMEGLILLMSLSFLAQIPALLDKRKRWSGAG